MPILAYLLARFSEPSSYAGLGAVLTLLGWQLSDPALSQLVQLLAAACGLAALLLRERGGSFRSPRRDPMADIERATPHPS